MAAALAAAAPAPTLTRRACVRACVQVQYPNALNTMVEDLGNLRAISYFLSKTEIKFDLVSAVDELNKQIKLEFDFTRCEARARAGSSSGAVIQLRAVGRSKAPHGACGCGRTRAAAGCTWRPPPPPAGFKPMPPAAAAFIRPHTPTRLNAPTYPHTRVPLPARMPLHMHALAHGRARGGVCA